MREPARPAPVWAVMLAGFAATLIGNGIGRFAYTPIIPAQVAAGWFSASQSAYFAAGNIAGYLIGAVTAAWLAFVIGSRAAIRFAALATVASLVACAWPVSVLWHGGWRFVAGVTGGWLMVLAVPVVVALAPSARRGLASGAVIAGVGFGVAGSGTVVPLLVQQGLDVVWLVLAAASLLLTAHIWWALPPDHGVTVADPGARTDLDASMLLVLAAYGCFAFGFVPHTILWVDFIARALGRGLEIGGAYWIAIGCAAAAGPFAAGFSADQFGAGRSFIVGLVLMALGVALPIGFTDPVSLAVSSVLVGAAITGMTALGSAWVAERVTGLRHRRIWGWMTAVFAVAQTAAAWLLSWIFATSGSHTLLFIIGAIGLAIGTVLACVALHLQPARSPG